MKQLFSVLTLAVLTYSIVACSKDDAKFKIFYSYTIEVESDLVNDLGGGVIKNDDDAQAIQRLFIDNKWINSKEIKGNTLGETDAEAKRLFDNIVEQATLKFSEMKLNGNAKLTYTCSRTDSNTSSDTEIARKEWPYLKNH